MSVPFFVRLEERAKGSNSLLCVGLDPHPELLSERSAAGALSFCLRIIEATADLACAFKPNSAFFEAFGPEGMKALEDVIQAIPEGIPVILDAKRGDISSTAKAYAEAIFSVLKADAVTVSPYLGWDSLEPMLKEPEHGIFMLCKTSNPSADEFQGMVVEGGNPPSHNRRWPGIVQVALAWLLAQQIQSHWVLYVLQRLTSGSWHPVWVHREATWKRHSELDCVRMVTGCLCQCHGE
jgi:orotidine 5'-phosphate decarboxylase subfamily 2